MLFTWGKIVYLTLEHVLPSETRRLNFTVCTPEVRVKFGLQMATGVLNKIKFSMKNKSGNISRKNLYLYIH